MSDWCEYLKQARSRQHLGDCGFDVNFGRIKKWNAVMVRIAENQRQFRSGEDDAVDVALCFHAIDDSKQTGAGLRQKFSGNKFAEIFLMQVILVVRVRHEKLDSFARENFWKEIGLHRVARPK